MTFVVRELSKAKQDKESIFRWLHARSPTGALAWLDAYDAALTRLANEAISFSAAPEGAGCDFDVRQVLFKTRRGRVYRLLFFVEGETVFVLRVRGPGQAPCLLLMFDEAERDLSLVQEVEMATKTSRNRTSANA